MELMKQLLAMQVNEAEGMTPAQAWVNMLEALDELNEDEGKTWSKTKANDEKGIELIKLVMDEGVQFDHDTAIHWAIDMMGSFEVTHHTYKSPKGTDTTAAKRFTNHIYEMVGLDKEYWHEDV
jgi:hypothetical protein